MSDKASFLENLALKLSGIPGLGFLDRYLTNIRAAKTSLHQKVAGYQAYASAATGAVQDVKDEFGKKKKPTSEDPASHEGK
jgi:hypothetical protein